MWPRYQGIPFRGAVPDVKKGDKVLPVRVGDVHVDIFELWDDEQRQAYADICSRFSKEQTNCQLSMEKWIEVEAHNSWKVMVRWIEWFAEMPKEGEYSEKQ